MNPKETNPVLNKQIVDGLKQLNTVEKPDFFVSLVELFQTSAAPVIQEVADLQSSGQWKMAARAAHRLKGSASNIGAARMAKLCQKLKDECDAEIPLATHTNEFVSLIKSAFTEATLELRNEN